MSKIPLVLLATTCVVATTASADTTATESPVGAPESPADVPSHALPDVPRFAYRDGQFWIERDDETLSLIFQAPGVRNVVEIITVPFSELGRIINIHYGERWSVIVTEKFAMITLGAEDVAEGRDKFRGNELLNADAIVLDDPPRGSAFAEDVLFLFYGDGVVRALRTDMDSTRIWKFTGLPEVSEHSVAVRSRGIYFLLQSGDVPLITLFSEGDGPWELQEYADEQRPVGPLIRATATPQGIEAEFESENGVVVVRANVEREGDPDSITVTRRRRRPPR